MMIKRIHGWWALAAASWVALTWFLLTVRLESADAVASEISVTSWIDSLAIFGHAALFGILAWLLHRSVVNPREKNRGPWYLQALWVAAIAAVGYGVATEMYQGLLPHRSTEMSDAIANTAGVACYAIWAKRGGSN